MKKRDFRDPAALLVSIFLMLGFFSLAPNSLFASNDGLFGTSFRLAEFPSLETIYSRIVTPLQRPATDAGKVFISVGQDIVPTISKPFADLKSDADRDIVAPFATHIASIDIEGIRMNASVGSAIVKNKATDLSDAGSENISHAGTLVGIGTASVGSAISGAWNSFIAAASDPFVLFFTPSKLVLPPPVQSAKPSLQNNKATDAAEANSNLIRTTGSALGEMVASLTRRVANLESNRSALPPAAPAVGANTIVNNSYTYVTGPGAQSYVGDSSLGGFSQGISDQIAVVRNDLTTQINNISVGSSSWSVNGGDIYRTSGNVGIGTSTPGSALTVVGNGQFSGNLTAASYFGDGSNLTGITSFSTSTTRNVFSSSATGLSYATSTGIFSLTSGYNIPLTASTTNWNSFFNTPSTRITAGTNLSWSGNTLNATGGGVTGSSDNSLSIAGSNVIINSAHSNIFSIVQEAEVSSSTGDAIGFYGEGVYNAADGLFNQIGVYGVAGPGDTPSGSWGVWGDDRSTFNNGGAGVYGTSIYNNGVYGISTGGTNAGVYGTGIIGVYGQADDTPGPGIGVYATSDSSAGTGLRIVQGNPSGIALNSSGGQNYIEQRLGVGLTPSDTISAMLHVSSTTEQLRLGYNVSNYNSFTVGSTGSLAISAVGTNPNITLTPGGTGSTILNGKVGIGTTTPSAKLDIYGTAGTGDIFSLSSSSNSRLFTVASTGLTTHNGGIIFGTDNTYDIGASGATRPKNVYIAGTLGGTSSYVSTAYVNTVNLSSNNNQRITSGNDSSGNSFGIQVVNTGWTSVPSIFRITSGGSPTIASDSVLANAGVGILQLGALITGNTFAIVNQQLQAMPARSGTDSNLAGANLTLQSGTGTGNATPSSLIFNTPMAVASGTGAQTQTQTMTLTNGNVGIGTTSPSAKLDIYGTAGTADIFGISSSSNSRLFTVTSAGNVGVGTTSPNALLTIGGSLSSTASAGLNFGGDTTANLYRSAAGTIKTDGSLNINGNLLFTVGSPTIFNNSGDLYIRSGSSGGVLRLGSNNTNDQMVINNGNVGIGTTSPSAKLAITGTAGTGDIFAIGSSTEARLLTFTSTGRLGIGTNTPTSPIDIQSDLTSTLGLIVRRNANQYIAIDERDGARHRIRALGDKVFSFSNEATSAGFEFITQSATGDSGQALTILANRTVGIGTTTPLAKLDIYGTAGTADIFAISSSTNSRLFTVTSAGNASLTGTFTLGGSLLGSSQIGFQSNGSGAITHAFGSGYININSDTGSLGFGQSTDTYLVRDAANILAQRNSTSAQTDRIYNTYTNASNYERGTFGWTSNALNIGTENAGTGVARSLNFQTASTTRMTIDTSGNVGIGTTSPSAKLDIYGTAGSSDIFALSSSTNARLFTVTAAGNVGIGTANPGALLDVGGMGTSPSFFNLIAGFKTSSNSASTMEIQNTSVGGSGATFLILEGVSASNPLILGQYGAGNGSSVWGIPAYAVTQVLAQTGNLLIGTQSATDLVFGTDDEERMRLTSAGYLGIGTTTPAFPLDVFSSVSSSQTYGFLNSSGSVGSSSGTNNYSIRAGQRIIASEFNAVSDARLKDVQFDLGSKISLDAISRLQPVSFTWKNNPTGQPVLGFLAQDVENVIPNAVSKLATENFPDQRDLSYNQIVTVSVGAIKELNLRTLILEATSTEMFKQSSLFGNIIAAIESYVFNTFSSKDVRTDKLCLDDVCVNKDQLRALLLNSGAGTGTGGTTGSSSTSGGSTSGGSTGGDGGTTSTSTDSGSGSEIGTGSESGSLSAGGDSGNSGTNGGSSADGSGDSGGSTSPPPVESPPATDSGTTQ